MATTAFAKPPRQLTHDGYLKRDPVYIAQDTVVYSVRAEKPRLVLMQLNLKTQKTRRLHPQSQLVEFHASCSRDGRRLAFQRMTGNDVCNVFIRDLPAGNARVVKTSKPTSYNSVLSPQGDALLYNLAGQIYLQDLTNGKEIQLTSSSGRNDWPAWSPRGHRIAFASSRHGDFDLYVMNREGELARRLTATQGLDMRPAWSPDGRQIVFTSNRDQNYELYLIDANGSNLQRLTHNAERDDFAAWHPAGNRIVYVAEKGGRFDLFEITLTP